MLWLMSSDRRLLPRDEGERRWNGFWFYNLDITRVYGYLTSTYFSFSCYYYGIYTQNTSKAGGEETTDETGRDELARSTCQTMQGRFPIMSFTIFLRELQACSFFSFRIILFFPH